MSGRKVLYVVDSLDRFATTCQLGLLANEIATDYEVHVAVLNAQSKFPIDLVSKPDSMQLHFLFNVADHQHSLRRMAQASWRLDTLIRSLEPEILHAFGHAAERVMLASSIRYSCAKKLVTELTIRPSTSLLSEMADQAFGRQVDHYIVPHDEVRKSLVRHRYCDQKITVIENSAPARNDDAIDRRHAARQSLIQRCGVGSDVYIAGAVAPLVPVSRLKDLIWATDLLTCIRDDFHFVIFGRGPQKKRLHRFAFQTQAGQHVHFIDAQVDAFALIPGLDVFWQSHLNEPLPTAMHHAMNHGVPVVSVFGSGTTESIEHQATAFATNFGARDEFARWTKYLIEQTQSATQLAIQGQQSLKGKYEPSAMADNYRNLYES